MAVMRSWLMQTRAELLNQRPPGQPEDVHFTESLASSVIGEYTSAGDVVLDPFAGFGTTAVVAARMGRRPVAVELLAERASYIRRRLRGMGEVITGDARRLDVLVSGPVDLCLTSPPYMTATGHRQNPMTGYTTTDGDYETYLGELAAVFGSAATLLRPGGHAVINVASVVTGATITPLAWDLARRVSAYLTLRQDVFICWDEQPAGISGDYCLVFQKADAG
jgi:DNA modification methylase